MNEPTASAGAVPDDDLALVRRIADGDRHALAVLYDRHVGWLTVRLERRCGRRELVDTAIQDTFLAVWKQAASYRETGDVGAWIWTIGVRRLIDQMRKTPPPQPVPDVAPLADVITHEVPLALGHTDLGQAFAALDPDLQAVMAATALDGLTNAEAATLLGVPTGTVKSRLSRARQILQEVLR
ncbi:MAG: RNA polymerase sigma factor [Actinomycetota bacterium]